jgi:hypothetical protein
VSVVRLVARYGAWTAAWEGGRLADVHHDEVEGAIDCFQVPGWDWQQGVSTGTRGDLGEALRRWAEEEGPTYMREEVAYRRRRLA